MAAEATYVGSIAGQILLIALHTSSFGKEQGRAVRKDQLQRCGSDVPAVGEGAVWSR